MKIILDAISKIGCLILSIILFFLICIYLVLDLSPKIITKENVIALVSEISIKDLINIDQNETLNEVYLFAEENNIDKYVVDKVIDSKEFKDIIVNYYGEMFDFVFYGGKITNVNHKEIMDIIDIDEILNNSILEEEQKDLIIDRIEELSIKLTKLFKNSEQIINELGNNNIESIRTVFGNNVKMIFIMFIIIVVLLMALLRWSIYRFAIWSGVTTTLIGTILVILGAYISDVVLNSSQVLLTDSIKLIIKNNILKEVSNIGTTILIIGIVQIFYYFVMRNIFKTKKY